MAKKWQSDIFFIEHFADERKLPLYWDATIELFDELRSWNAMLGDKRLSTLAPMKEAALEKKLSTAPMPLHELKAAELLAQAKQRMKFGAMQDG